MDSIQMGKCILFRVENFKDPIRINIPNIARLEVNDAECEVGLKIEHFTKAEAEAVLGVGDHQQFC